MIARTPTVSLSIRDHFLADHRRLEGLLTRLGAAFEANDREDMRAAWSELDTGLLAHMDAEETHLLPVLMRVSERDARAILQEHHFFRTRLLQLGIDVDLHTVRLPMVQEFIAQLQAHARSEDTLLYSWADTRFTEPEATTILESLELIRERRAARRETR